MDWIWYSCNDCLYSHVPSCLMEWMFVSTLLHFLKQTIGAYDSQENRRSMLWVWQTHQGIDVFMAIQRKILAYYLLSQDEAGFTDWHLEAGHIFVSAVFAKQSTMWTESSSGMGLLDGTDCCPFWPVWLHLLSCDCEWKRQSEDKW